MSISRIKFDGNDLINLENDTVRADKLLKDYTAHDYKGDLIIGTYTPSTPTGENIGVVYLNNKLRVYTGVQIIQSTNKLIIGG